MKYTGEGEFPYELIRARVCEKMGWTFPEFDAAPAVEIFTLMEFWRIEKFL